jgi:hypothetical protein
MKLKLKKSDALKMKYQALRWLRLDQRCMFIATEVGMFSSDVLGCNETKLIEVEVKVSFTDFKNDFHKWKHSRYSGMFANDAQWVPTHFYFAMPENLIEKAKKFLEEREKDYPKVGNYGLINMNGWKVTKRAKWIHKNEPASRVKAVMALRMGSELIRFHEAWI